PAAASDQNSCNIYPENPLSRFYSNKCDLNRISLRYTGRTKKYNRKKERFMMKMNKLLVALPLSLAMLVPTAALADSHGGHSGGTNESAHSAEIATDTAAAELRIQLDTILTEHA